MTEEFEFDFEELEITDIAVGELMGFDKGEAPEPFRQSFLQALEQAKQVCKPVGGFSVFDTILVSDNSIEIGNRLFYPDKIVLTQLKKSEKIAVFVSTAGGEITQLAKNTVERGDAITAFVLDTIGSVVADRTAAYVQHEVESKFSVSGLKISDRFSPGYCNWSVAEQHLLFSLLPPSFCGITLAPSALMHPIKSVSGFIGIGKNLNQKGYQCHWCTDKDCFIGKINRMKKDEKK